MLLAPPRSLLLGHPAAAFAANLPTVTIAAAVAAAIVAAVP